LNQYYISRFRENYELIDAGTLAEKIKILMEKSGVGGETAIDSC